MQISKIGEFGLIDRLTKDLPRHNASTLKAAGDDCAVIAATATHTPAPADTAGKNTPAVHTLVTTDMLMEGVHFDLTYITMEQLGYKSAMVNISDVFAMNGVPQQMTVSLALSKRFTVEDLDAFYAGLRQACDKWGVDIVGGDTTASLTGLAISITVIGQSSAQDTVYRSGAKDTDLICVSGDLGAAYMGLQLLEREKAVYYQQLRDAQQKAKAAGRPTDPESLNISFTPDFAGKEYLLERQLKPEARGDIIRLLMENNIHPTAMMDISDGLSSELMHICKQSGCGCRVYEKNIPIDYQTAVMAEEMNMNVTTCAMNGGEDYELLFTVPIGDHAKVEDLEGIKVIGHITRPELGHILVTRDSQEFDIKAQGWNPL